MRFDSSFVPCNYSLGKGLHVVWAGMKAISSNSWLVVQLLGYATEELSLRVGQTLAGLLNATLVRILIPQHDGRDTDSRIMVQGNA